MKRVFFILTILSVFAFGSNFYELGQKAEAKGDFKNAMIYYKKAFLEANSNPDFKKINSLNDDEISTIQNSSKTSKINNFENNTKISDLDGRNLFDLEIYKPTYMLFTYDFDKKKNRNQKELKFQFSLQYPLFYDLFGFDEVYALAYTQTSWWQVWEKSAPFRETNYKPEIFVKVPSNGLFNYYKVGLLHDSNGKGGLSSRSWNRAYLQTSLNFYGFEIVPRAWWAFGFDDNNKGINNYLGYGDLNINYNFGRQKFNAMLRNNLNFNGKNRGAIELNYNFPIYRGLYGYIQYFSGYGESLIDYNKHVDKIGIGLSILE